VLVGSARMQVLPILAGNGEERGGGKDGYAVCILPELYSVCGIGSARVFSMRTGEEQVRGRRGGRGGSF